MVCCQGNGFSTVKNQHKQACVFLLSGAPHHTHEASLEDSCVSSKCRAFMYVMGFMFLSGDSPIGTDLDRAGPGRMLSSLIELARLAWLCDAERLNCTSFCPEHR